MIGIKGASGVEGKIGPWSLTRSSSKQAWGNFDDIAKLFGAATSGETKVFTRIHDALFDWTSSDGILKLKTDTLQRQMSELDKQVAAMEDRLAKREEYYYTKFAAMEKALASMQSQSAWLSAQLSAFSSMGKK